MPTSLDLAGRLSAVVALQQEILSVSQDLENVMQRVVNGIPQLTSGTGAVIELVDGDELVYRAASGPAAGHIGTRLPLSNSLSAMAVQMRNVIRCNDVETDPRVDRAACRRIGIRSMVVAPLLEGDHARGALKSYSDRADAFDDLDSYTVQLLAGMTSSALMLAQEFHNRQASEERYRMLFERNVAGVFRTTEDGRILDCNDAFVETLGYASREELLEKQTWDLYRERTDRQALLDSVRSKPLKNVRLPLKKKDGTPLNGLVSVSLLTTDSGQFQLLGTLVEE